MRIAARRQVPSPQ